MTPDLTIDDVREAARRVHPYVHRTPVLTCSALDRMCDKQLFFKCENFQKTGSFKIRGAINAVLALTDKAAHRGVVTHSSGNFAAALALAAGLRGIQAHVVMPSDVPQIKKTAVACYGAAITYCEPVLAARETGVAAVIERTGAAFIHPSNQREIIAGQGTAALELISAVPDLDGIVAPVGGGGLLGGIALAAQGAAPAIPVYGAEPEAADDAYRSVRAGYIIPSNDPDTIADGLLTSLGDVTFPIIQAYVRDIILTSEAEIVRSMRLVWERMKIIIEPSAAVSLAAVMALPRSFEGKRIGIVFSGGNADLNALPWQNPES
ncbi:MAG: pyridoxal-phosphate dependent enzyme [Myxococcota bacterium]|nr:pyridoxal-phosphate dependent enzyme [Myxococcota bacterium]